MEPKVKTSQNVDIVTEKESEKETNTRKLLNIIGLFLFGGMALMNVTNPLPERELTKESLLFIGGSAILYYVLLNIYFIGPIGRRIVFIFITLFVCFSMFMAFYLAVNTTAH